MVPQLAGIAVSDISPVSSVKSRGLVSQLSSLDREPALCSSNLCSTPSGKPRRVTGFAIALS